MYRDDTSFSDTAIVFCGALSLELNHLKESGFLDAKHIFYTTPGLHEDPKDPERQLLQRVEKAKDKDTTTDQSIFLL